MRHNFKAILKTTPIVLSTRSVIITTFLFIKVKIWIRIHFCSVSDPGFFPDPDQTFFLSPDPDRPKIRIRSGKIRIREKNVLKLELK